MSSSTVYEITDESLKQYCGIVKNRYSHANALLLSRIKSASQNNPFQKELQDSVLKYSVLFTGIQEAVLKTAEHDHTITSSPTKQDLLSAYSLYIAARTVAKDLESIVGDGMRNVSEQGSIQIPEKEQFQWSNNPYSNVTSAISSSLTYVLAAKDKPVRSMKEFFENYANIVNHEILSHTEDPAYNKLKDIKWKIGNYEIEGMKEIITSTIEVGSATIEDKERQQFYTPLKYLTIPKNEVLPRNRIVGDQSIVDYLERMIVALFCYNPTAGFNPLKDEEDIFTSAILLEGNPGTGKGVVSYHTIDYAERLNQRLKGNLVVTEFIVDSSWKSGKILKLRSQLEQIGNENKLFLIFQDEITRLLKKEGAQNGDSDNEDVVLELQKFLNGTYPNRGNYIMLATTNKLTSIPKAIRDRFYLQSWTGAESAEQKAELYRFKLERGLSKGYVKVNDDEFRRLGLMAYESGLSGRYIAHICKTIKQKCFRWQDTAELLQAREGDITKQIEIKNQLFSKITYEGIERETATIIEARKKGELNSLEYERN